MTTIFRTVKSWKELEETEGAELVEGGIIIPGSQTRRGVGFSNPMKYMCGNVIEIQEWDGWEGWIGLWCITEHMLRPEMQHNRNNANEEN